MGLRDMAAPAGVAAGASQASSPETAPGVELPTVESPAPTQPDEPNHAGGEVDAAAVEQVFDFCLQQIYGGKSPEGDLNPHVAEMLRSGEDPTDSLADTAATVVSSAAMKHEGVTGDVLAVAMFGVIAELADASREVGLYEYSEEEMGGRDHQRQGRTHREHPEHTGRVGHRGSDQRLQSVDGDEREWGTGRDVCGYLPRWPARGNGGSRWGWLTS